MTEQEIIRILEESGALLTGHFQLRSGLHSNRFFQAALLLQYPDKAETVCRFLAEQYKNEKIDAVISPEVGGLIVGQEVARALGGGREPTGNARFIPYLRKVWMTLIMSSEMPRSCSAEITLFSLLPCFCS